MTTNDSAWYPTRHHMVRGYQATITTDDSAVIFLGIYPDWDDDFPTYVGRIGYHPLAGTTLASVYFVWRGGGYVDFGTADVSALRRNSVTPDDVEAVDVFNVFDYEFDGLLIERSADGFVDFLATFDRDDVDRVLETIAGHTVGSVR
jgi:hypothetical protein